MVQGVPRGGQGLKVLVLVAESPTSLASISTSPGFPPSPTRPASSTPEPSVRLLEAESVVAMDPLSMNAADAESAPGTLLESSPELSPTVEASPWLPRSEGAAGPPLHPRGLAAPNPSHVHSNAAYARRDTSPGLAVRADPSCGPIFMSGSIPSLPFDPGQGVSLSKRDA
jgi:hypothetical protein